MKIILFIFLLFNYSYTFSFSKSISSLGGYYLNQEYVSDNKLNKKLNGYYNLDVLENIENFSHYDIKSKHIDIELNKNNLIKTIYLSYNFNTNIYKILKFDLEQYIKTIEKEYTIKFKKKIISIDKNTNEIEYFYKNNLITLNIYFFSNLDKVHNINIELKTLDNK